MENLKEIRKEKGLTQIDVAKAVGISLTTYQLWERGVSHPREENERKLREVLEIQDNE